MEKVQAINKVLSRVKTADSRRYSEIHYHNEHELYFLLSGEVKYFIGDEIIPLHKGDLIFIPKGILHKTDSENCLNVERLLISFGDEVVDNDILTIIEEFSKEKLICVPQNKLPIIEDAYCKIEKETKKERPFKEAMIRAYIRELLIIIARIKTDEKDNIYNHDSVITSVAEYISEHFSEELTLKLLCHKFAFSEAHLSKKFKKAMGIGINEYINYIRVLQAEKFLKESNYSVMEISQKCGFNDSNYFTTVFKKFMGITPHKYRKTSQFY